MNKNFKALLYFIFLFNFVGLSACNTPKIKPTTQANLLQTTSATSLPLPTVMPTPALTATPTIQPLPQGIGVLKIDGYKSTPEMEDSIHTWVWRNKKGVIHRVMDPDNGHILARTSVPYDRLTYDIDLAFGWEVNLVNYEYYGSHAPFGIAYVKLLQAKYPDKFPQTNEKTGIIFRIIQGTSNDISGNQEVVTISDKDTDKESIYLSPVYSPQTNEYVFTMVIKTDYLNKIGSVNTYTKNMLNYCISAKIPENPSGSWGIVVYKHTIK
jgi:hypothetical protein